MPVRPGVAAVSKLVGIGIVAGLFSALFGIGGGLVVVPLLLLVVHLPPHVATASSLGAILITALAGVVVYAFRGEVDVGHAALVGLPAVVGAYLGTGLQQRVSGRGLTRAFA